MDIIFLKKIFGNFKLFADRTDITDSRLGGFFHNISQLTCQTKFSFTRHHIDFYFQCIAAYACPGESSHNTDFICFAGMIKGVFFFSQIFFQILFGNGCFFLIPFVNLSGSFPADFADFTFQAPHSRLFCIASNHHSQRLFANGNLFFLQAVFLHLFAYQMLFCNVHFLVFRIAADFNQLHAVQKRPWNVLHGISRCNKQNFRQINGNLHVMVSEFLILL